MHFSRDRLDSFRAMIDRIHGSDHRKEDLGGAYVRGRFLTPDVLLAGLQRQAIGNAPPTIDGNAYQAARQRALVCRLGRDIGGVRTAVSDRYSEPLGRSDRDVCAELARRGEQRERQGIGRHHRECAGRMQGCDRLPEVADLAGASGILKESAE